LVMWASIAKGWSYIANRGIYTDQPAVNSDTNQDLLNRINTGTFRPVEGPAFGGGGAQAAASTQPAGVVPEQGQPTPTATQQQQQPGLSPEELRSQRLARFGQQPTQPSQSSQPSQGTPPQQNQGAPQGGGASSSQ